MSRIHSVRNVRARIVLLSVVSILAILASCGAPAATDVVSVTSAPLPRIPTPAATSSPIVATVLPSRAPTARPTASPTASETPLPTMAPTLTPTPTLPPTTAPTLPSLGSSLLPTETVSGTVAPTPAPLVKFDKDVVNILLIGLDSTVNLRGQNSDVIIVVSVNKKTRQVSMLSIPRDLWVYIPTYGWNRINTAHRRGYSLGYPGEGPALLARTIELNLGVTTQHWARVDFTGFQRVVDTLGGVDITVSCPVNLRYKKPTSPDEEEMLLQPGQYHMEGEFALRYVRTRRNGSDFDRAHRQQQFLKAMWVQFKDPGLILKIPQLYSALKGSVTTDLSLGDLLALARVGIDLKPQQVHSYYIGPNETQDWMTPQGWAVLLQRPDRIQQVVAWFASPASTQDPIAEEAAAITILNGTTRANLTKFAADQLQWYGVKVTAGGNADRTDYKQTQIIVYHDKPEAEALLAKLLKVKAANILKQPDAGQSVDIQVILGADYDPCK